MQKTGDGPGRRVPDKKRANVASLKHTPATWRQIQNAHERNHAKPPTRLGLESTVTGCS